MCGVLRVPRGRARAVGARGSAGVTDININIYMRMAAAIAAALSDALAGMRAPGDICLMNDVA